MLGFSAVFIALGAAVTAVGQLLYDLRSWLALIGGIVVVIFGLATAGWINIPFLEYDTRYQGSGGRDLGYLSSFLMGVFFSAGWTPCVGPTLGAILTLGMNESTVGQGVFLLVGYSLGLGIPFLLTGLAVDRATTLLRRARRYMPAIKMTTAVLLDRHRRVAAGGCAAAHRAASGRMVRRRLDIFVSGLGAIHSRPEPVGVESRPVSRRDDGRRGDHADVFCRVPGRACSRSFRRACCRSSRPTSAT